MNSKCKDDSCDAVHCPICGGHKLSFYSLGICDSCQLDIDYDLDKLKNQKNKKILSIIILI